MTLVSSLGDIDLREQSDLLYNFTYFPLLLHALYFSTTTPSERLRTFMSVSSSRLTHRYIVSNSLRLLNLGRYDNMYGQRSPFPELSKRSS
jgi:hypothetical protein